MGSYFGAKVLATTAIAMQSIVAAVVVYELTQSALMVGFVSVAQFGPQLLLSPWMGAVADRGNRRRQVVAGWLIAATGSGILAYGAATSSPVLVLLSAAGVVGIGFAVSSPAMHAIIPALAQPAELATVVTIATSPSTIARTAGPAIGAILMVAVGPVAAFVAAATCQLMMAAVVGLLTLRPMQRSRADHSVLAGFRFLRQDLTLSLLLVGVACIGFGVDPIVTLTPSLSNSFDGGSELVAVMASVFGLGAGTITLFQGKLRQRVGIQRLGLQGLSVLALSLFALAASPTFALALTSLFIGGAGMMTAVTSFTTQIQARVPEEMRGRIMALWSVCFVGSRPLAAMVNGSISDLSSPNVALCVLGMAILATTIAIVRVQARDSHLSSNQAQLAYVPQAQSDSG